jgi:hypothetical protein
MPLAQPLIWSPPPPKLPSFRMRPVKNAPQPFWWPAPGPSYAASTSMPDSSVSLFLNGASGSRISPSVKFVPLPLAQALAIVPLPEKNATKRFGIAGSAARVTADGKIDRPAAPMPRPFKNSRRSSFLRSFTATPPRRRSGRDI